MLEETKVKIFNRIFKICFFALLITFITLYFSQATGYYEFEQHQKTVLTEEQIKKFEKDVLNGKNIDLENYITNPKKNYQNKTSQFGLNISEGLGKYVRKSVDGFFGALGKIVEQ